MENVESHDDNFFIKNAILCWLHHYGDQGHRWNDVYKELAERDVYISMEPDAKPKPRPARRRVTKPKAA